MPDHNVLVEKAHGEYPAVEITKLAKISGTIQNWEEQREDIVII